MRRDCIVSLHTMQPVRHYKLTVYNNMNITTDTRLAIHDHLDALAGQELNTTAEDMIDDLHQTTLTLIKDEEQEDRVIMYARILTDIVDYRGECETLAQEILQDSE